MSELVEILKTPWALVIIFLVASVLGYKIIKNVPSLLHTPLMSGSNALSGVTIIGALSATGGAVIAKGTLGIILGVLAIIFATINVVGGFAITHKMLRMFQPKNK